MIALHTNLSAVLTKHDSGVWGDEDLQNGVSVLRSTNMENDGSIDFSNLTFRSVPRDKSEAKLLKPGDIILENSGGGPKQPVGRVCYFHGDDRAHVVGNFCRRLRANHGVANSRYLFWRLFYAHSTGETLRFQTQTTGIRNLQFKAYASQPLTLPALSEQARIVDLIDEAERLRKLRHQADAKAARILPALFIKMFGDPATNPKGFRKEPLGKLIKVKSGDFLPAKDMAANGLCPVYGGNGVNGFHDQYMFEERKVVLGRVGAYCGVVHYSEPRAWITDNALYVSEKFEPLDDRYLVAALEVANLNQYAGRAGQPLISGSRIYPIEILVPPETAQHVFAKSVAVLIELDEQREKAGKQLDQLWDVLMQRAFSGELTAKWRAAHMKELLAEMGQQARLLNLPLPNTLGFAQ